MRISGGPGAQTADPVNGGHHPTMAPKALRAFQSTMKMLPPLNPPGCGLWRLWEPSVRTGIGCVRSQSPSEGLRVEPPLRAGSWWPLRGSLGRGPRSLSSREKSGPEAQGLESISSPPFSFLCVCSRVLSQCQFIEAWWAKYILYLVLMLATLFLLKFFFLYIGKTATELPNCQTQLLDY